MLLTPFGIWGSFRHQHAERGGLCRIGIRRDVAEVPFPAHGGVGVTLGADVLPGLLLCRLGPGPRGGPLWIAISSICFKSPLFTMPTARRASSMKSVLCAAMPMLWKR